jgi:peptidoglycan hydrolase-like protein with peptidoglycan-binding domain
MEKSLNEQLVRQLSLINYDRGKTLIEQNLFMEESNPIEETITFVEGLGFTASAIGTNYSDCKSANQVFAKAAIYGIKKITDAQIARTAIGAYDCLTVKVNAVDGSAPKPFKMETFSLDNTVKETLNGVIVKLITDGATLNADVSIGSLFFLQSFYFEWGEIVKDYTDAFKTDKDAYKSKLFPDGWWNFFNFWYKTDTFTTALSDVKSSEKFRCNGDTIINITYGDDWVERNQKEGIQGVKDMLTTMAHIALPLGAFLLTIGSGGALLPILLGSGLELIDSSIYMFVDKDPYMAGMTAIFALVGPLDAGLGALLAKVGKPFLKKLALKFISFTDDELEIMKYFTKNGVRLAKLAKLNAGRQLIKYHFKNLKSNYKVARFCIFLIQKLGLPIGKAGLIMGGPIYGWDFIAAKLGLCNSMELKGFKESDWKILKIIGYLGEPLQPFTEGCESVLAKKTLTDLEKTLLTNNGRIKTSIEEGIKSEMVYSTKVSKFYMYEVLYIQYLLQYLGYNKFTEEYSEMVDTWVKISKPEVSNYLGYEIPPQNDVPGLTSYDPRGGIGASRKVSGLPATGYKSSDKENLTLKQIPVKKTRNANIEFKWGYYDDKTEKVIREYQKAKNLLVDGSCGVNTLNRMLVSINNVKKEIPNYGNVNLSPEEIQKIRNKTIEEMNKLKAKWESISEENVKIELEKQTDSIQKKTEDEIKKLEFTEDQLVEITNGAKEIEAMG